MVNVRNVLVEEFNGYQLWGEEVDMYSDLSGKELNVDEVCMLDDGRYCNYDEFIEYGLKNGWLKIENGIYYELSHNEWVEIGNEEEYKDYIRGVNLFTDKEVIERERNRIDY